MVPPPSVGPGASSSSVTAASASEEGAADRSSILSMKKSAEIAAVFSGARINQTTDIVDELRQVEDDSESNCSCCNGGDGAAEGGYSSDGADSTDVAYETRKSCPTCGGGRQTQQQLQHQQRRRSTDMKSSLGYFP